MLKSHSSFQSAESGFLKDLRQKLLAFENSRCDTGKQCVEMVKSGHTVYIGAVNGYLLPAMQEDFKATQQCTLDISKINYVELPIGWAMQKNKPYADVINVGYYITSLSYI